MVYYTCKVVLKVKFSQSPPNAGRARASTPVISVHASGHGLWILLSKNECGNTCARLVCARVRCLEQCSGIYDNNVSCMSTSHKYVKPFRLYLAIL